MPRSNCLQIYQVHIADGFSSDCDELVHRCLQLKNLDFQEFCKIWKEMNFDLIYQGRSSGAEIAELSEELIYIAKHYMVKDTSYFAESVTGLFIVYSLVNLQPFSGFACLRIIPEDVRAINRIEMVARRERRLDVLYILGEVLTKWSQYHAAERPRGMESVIRKYLEGYTSIDKLGVRPMGVFYRQNEELDHIRDLSSMTRQYTLAKKALFGDAPPDPSLQYINENLSQELSASLRKLISGIIDDTEEDALDDDDDSSSEDEKQTAEDRSQTLQAIKFKAMSNAVDPMKHLTSADERKKSQVSPTTKSDLKKPIGKIKTGTHTKPVTTSPKKRKTEEKGAKKKQKFTSKTTTDDSDDADLNVDEFHRLNDSVTSIDLTTDQDDHQPQQEIDEFEIEIDSIPLTLSAGDLGPDIEIEIIDHTKKQKPTKTETSPNKTKCSNEHRRPVTLKTGKKLLKTFKDTRSMDCEETCVIPKREKRELKRREVKSKFKKMGMLPVANFKDQNKDNK